MCGENQSANCVLLAILGSPPRVRGKQEEEFVVPSWAGITPACAGKTISDFLPADFLEDHPRVCGENMSLLCSSRADTGSPPRVRGKRASSSSHEQKGGITPACAGKTRENIGKLRQGLGSPPRVRGKQRASREHQKKRGITPACAGKTWNRERSQPMVGDHPRVCGENQACPSSFRPRPGSPPRVRGKPALHQLPHARYGITPACAGKTRAWHTGRATKRDHPRVCGENKTGMLPSTR